MALAAELAANPDAFGELARAHSDCASAGEGGRLGQLTPGEVTPEFAAAVAELAEGETTLAPVETRYGFTSSASIVGFRATSCLSRRLRRGSANT